MRLPAPTPHFSLQMQVVGLQITYTLSELAANWGGSHDPILRFDNLS